MKLYKGLTDLLVLGLLTDGGHHKQWALEEALKLIDPELLEHYQNEEDIERGIAP